MAQTFIPKLLGQFDLTTSAQLLIITLFDFFYQIYSLRMLFLFFTECSG